jgi:hypothetical protein
VFWNLVAPRPHARRRPRFGPGGAGDPKNYPQHSWDRYDELVRLAQKNRLTLLFTVSGPAPNWAVPGKRRVGYRRPKASQFRDFVHAVGQRYSGTYAVADAGNSRPLPRVDAWSIWNEPNFPTWLGPQRVRRGRGGRDIIPTSPRLYRQLIDGAYRGLNQSGHGGDSILLGELAPRGDYPKDDHLNKTMIPLGFVRELFCVKRNFSFYRGRAARLRGCPANARGRGRFVASHPGLFRATGWAHHPYSFDHKPTWAHKVIDAIPLGGINRMLHQLDRAYARWHVNKHLPIWMTEYGYQTRPPDPYVGVSWSRQASWTSWGEEISYRNPRIASFAQFLLVDDRPLRKKKGRPRWITWQSGLFTAGGKRKPYYDEFQRPIRVSPTTTGGDVTVFGGYRPAANGASIRARIELRPRDGNWQTLRTVTVTNERGYLLERVEVPRSGDLHIVWTDPASGDQDPSRSIPVVRR